MIQGQYPRLKDNIRFDRHDETDRKVTFHLMLLLYNFQTAKMGINQILNSFMGNTKGFQSYAIRANGDLQAVDAIGDGVFFE